MKELRSPETGCEWNRQQDFESLAQYTIEEAYEVVEAIEENDTDKLKDELGDLLFQVVFQAQVADEKGLFSFEDVAKTAADKMHRRHAHVFGDYEAKTLKDIDKMWKDIKAAERTKQTQDETSKSALDGITKTLPALTRALKLSERAVHSGFDWETTDGVIDKIHEELNELQVEINSGDNQLQFEELGDVLFTLVNLARWQKHDPESALKYANKKFERRFRAMEALAFENGTTLNSLSFEDREDLWHRVKINERAD